MITMVAKLLAALNANARPGEIAAAAAFGLMLALIPGGNLLWVGLFVLIFFLKIHLATALLVMALARLGVPFADPLIGWVGLKILTIEGLHSIFTGMANAPVLPYTNFNNSLVLGGLLTGIAAWIPVFLLFSFLVRLYRNLLWPKLANSRLVKAFQRLPLVKKIGKAVGKVSRIPGGLV